MSSSLILAAIYYLINGREQDELSQLVDGLKQKLPNLGDEIMTYAEQLRKEGRNEGRNEAQMEIALRLLKAGVDITLIAKSTHLPLSKIEELSKSLN